MSRELSDPVDSAAIKRLRAHRLDWVRQAEEEILEEPDEGGTLIRSATGKMYFIPESLESYEVLDEDEKSELLLTSFDDLDGLSISVGRDPDSSDRAAFRQRLPFRHQLHADERGTSDKGPDSGGED